MYHGDLRVAWSVVTDLGWHRDDPECHIREVVGKIIAYEENEDGLEVGEIHLQRFDVGEATCYMSLYDLFDSQSDLMSQVYEVLFEQVDDENELRKPIQEICCKLDMASYVVFVESIWIAPEFRRRRYGLGAMIAAIEEFARESYGVVVIEPAPIVTEPGAPEEGTPEHAAAVERLTAHWAQLGFAPIGKGFHAFSSDRRYPWRRDEPTMLRIGIPHRAELMVAELVVGDFEGHRATIAKYRDVLLHAAKEGHLDARKDSVHEALEQVKDWTEFRYRFIEFGKLGLEFVERGRVIWSKLYDDEVELAWDYLSLAMATSAVSYGNEFLDQAFRDAHAAAQARKAGDP